MSEHLIVPMPAPKPSLGYVASMALLMVATVFTSSFGSAGIFQTWAYNIVAAAGSTAWMKGRIVVANAKSSPACFADLPEGVEVLWRYLMVP